MNQPTVNGSACELISFRLAAQDFCVDIMAVREIRGWTPATALPGSPDFVRGVINLRGAVLPIVDLAFRLGFDATTPTAKHVIIVAEIGGQMIGLLVDAVSDILTEAEDAIQPTPDVASDAARSVVRGLLATEGRMISLISLDHVLPEPALAVTGPAPAFISDRAQQPDGRPAWQDDPRRVGRRRLRPGISVSSPSCEICP